MIIEERDHSAALSRGEPSDISALELASIYRALRKGREDQKDAPGATDLYYGEMEMRRRARSEDPTGSSSRVERGILHLYWLLSGYSSRAWRAATALAVVIVAGAAIFHFFGFEDGKPTPTVEGVSSSGALVYGQIADAPPAWHEALRALTFSASTATAIVQLGSDRRLTVIGEITRVALRLLGPLLIALVVLSVRGRVRR